MAPNSSSGVPAVPGGLTPDAELVRRVVAGDRAVFEILMRRHNQRVYRAIRSILRDEAEVEDAMQQTYLLAFSHLASFEGASSFTTWLSRIAVNEALGRLRRSVRLVSLPDHDEAAEDPNMPFRPSPEDDAVHHQSVQILERAIDRLPPIHRSVLMLREIEQLSTGETAAVLDVSEEAVRIRLHRARLALRDAYADEVRDQAGAAFRFHAPRCDRVVAAVMAKITGEGWPGPAAS